MTIVTDIYCAEKNEDIYKKPTAPGVPKQSPIHQYYLGLSLSLSLPNFDQSNKFYPRPWLFHWPDLALKASQM
jgi:hypothetical protein